MARKPWLFSSVPIRCLAAVLLVAGATGVVLLLGGRTPDRLLLALVYILPVGWSAACWGRWPCTCAALAAMLAGQFLFIPVRDVLARPGLAAWLLLAAVLAGGNLLADRLQAALTRSPDRIYEEYQSVFVHGLRTALAGLHTPEEVTVTLATYLRQLLQAVLVEVQVQAGPSVALIMRSPVDGRAERGPDRIVPLPGVSDVAGEIRLWGDSSLPPEDSCLLRRLVAQGAFTLARVSGQDVALQQDVPTLAGLCGSVTAGYAAADVIGQPTNL